MKLQRIRYERKVPQERYGNETYEIEYSEEEGEKRDPLEIFKHLKKLVEVSMSADLAKMSSDELYKQVGWELPDWLK